MILSGDDFFGSSEDAWQCATLFPRRHVPRIHVRIKFSRRVMGQRAPTLSAFAFSHLPPTLDPEDRRIFKQLAISIQIDHPRSLSPRRSAGEVIIDLEIASVRSSARYNISPPLIRDALSASPNPIRPTPRALSSPCLFLAPLFSLSLRCDIAAHGLLPGVQYRGVSVIPLTAVSTRYEFPPTGSAARCIRPPFEGGFFVELSGLGNFTRSEWRTIAIRRDCRLMQAR